MPCHVDVYEDVLEAIEEWSLPESVKAWLLETMLDDLSTKLSSAIGEWHSVAPVRLRRYSLSARDPSGLLLHHFLFLVHDSAERRVVMMGTHRTGEVEL